MGHSIKYWLELQRRFEDQAYKFDGPRLLEEIADLRGRLDFHESRIREMNAMVRR